MSDNQDTGNGAVPAPSGTGSTTPGAAGTGDHPVTGPATGPEGTDHPGTPATGSTTPGAAPADGDDGDPDAGESDARVRKARREAAGYRERLRDTEGERDRLSGELSAARDALTAARRAQAADIVPGVRLDVLETLGLDLTDHLTDDGAVDLSAARVAARALAGEAGILPPTAPRVPGEGRGPGVLPSSGNWLRDNLM